MIPDVIRALDSNTGGIISIGRSVSGYCQCNLLEELQLISFTIGQLSCCYQINVLISV